MKHLAQLGVKLIIMVCILTPLITFIEPSPEKRVFISYYTIGLEILGCLFFFVAIIVETIHGLRGLRQKINEKYI